MNYIKNVTYPSIEDEAFQRKIYEKREFYYNRIPEKQEIREYSDLKQYRDNICSGKFNLLNQQNTLANFINPDTPFKGLLIFHGTGTGKTCSAVAICENFKEQVKKYNTKIYILVPGPLNKENWKDEIVKCTKDTYKKEGDGNLLDPVEKDRVMCKAKAAALQYYRIMSYRGFYKKVLGQKIIERTDVKKKTYKKTEEGEYERDLSIDRIDNLNNAVIVVDEAHNITGNEYGQALQKIIDNSQNLRILLLSATPMKNLGDDIVEMLNYMRPKKDPILRDRIFTSDKNYMMELKPNGLEYLKKMTQGYVSYYRGSDPATFAKQIDMGEIPKGILFTPVVRCPMEKFQFGIYNSVKDDTASNLEDALERRSAAVANFAIPGLTPDKKGVAGYFGREGLSTLRSQLNSNKLLVQTKIKEKFFPSDAPVNDIIFDTKNKNIGGLIFHRKYLPNFSIKFANCLDNIMELVEGAKGARTAFVYSNLVKSGIELFEQVLIQNGCLEWNENGNYNINDNTRDAITGMPYSEFVKSEIRRQFYPMTFLTITGQSEESKDAIPEEKKRILDTVFSNIDNLDGRHIKFVLGSKVMNEGITLRNVREVHILDVYFNLGKVYQVIGRAIRHCVHYDIMNEEDPYPEVSIFRYTVSVPDKSKLSTEEELYQKAEKKFMLIKQVERAIKEVAIDCPLNYNGNVLKEELGEYENCRTPGASGEGKLCPAACDYTACGYMCGDKSLNLKHYDNTTRLYRAITRENLDYSTFTTKLARSEIDTAKELIKEMYRFQYVYTLDEIKKKITKKYPEDKRDMLDMFFVYKALDELIPTTENDFNNFKDTIFDKYNVSGYLIYRGKYYIFQPFNENENVLMYYRSTYMNDLKHELTIREYIRSDAKMNKLLEETENKYDNTKVKFKFDLEYYDSKDDFKYVGILDNNKGDEVFKLREGRSKVVMKKRVSGIPSIKGAVCFTANDKEQLMNIGKEIGVKNLNAKTSNRYSLCDLIKHRLLYLEKYADDKKTYMIVPTNHPKYPFPFNLEDRVNHISKRLNNTLLTNISLDKKKQDGGIFEELRDKSLPKYTVSFAHEKAYEKNTQEIQQLGFSLQGNKWSMTVE